MIKLSASLLAADAARLGEEAGRAAAVGCDELHYDVMDGHFVPNLSFGTHILKALSGKISAFWDVHLMMTNPLKYIDAFGDAGASLITIHAEAEQVGEALDKIHSRGLAAGLSIRPGTPVEKLLPHLPGLERVLLMTVEPGFGGQKLQPQVFEKAKWLRSQGFLGDIEADGGLNPDNAGEAVRAGINVLVMGTAFFRAENPEQVVSRIHELSEEARGKEK